jgi:Na+-driven multidrug efflux pump
MLTECGSIWLVAVPLAFMAALVWHLPVHLALLLTRTESLIKAVILLGRFKSKKWMNTVIEDL